MNDTFDNEADSDNDDDGEEIPRVPRAGAAKKNGAAKNGAAPTKKATSAKESERKKRELITMGKAKGFLTYDEVNEHMPESIVSSILMDNWLTAFASEGIENVDSPSKVKIAEQDTGKDAAEEAEGETAEATKEAAEEAEEAKQ